MSESAVLGVERRGAVAVLSLERPRAANALSAALQGALVEALATADADPAVGAVMLTAPPGRAFSAGADMKEYSELPLAEATRLRRELLCTTMLSLVDFGKPLLALVQGKAVGAGCMLPCLADEVHASEAAGFSLPELRLGSPTALGVTIVGARAGRRTAIRLAQLDEMLDVHAAHAAGLVDRVSDSATAFDDALSRAAAMAGCAGAAFAENKRWLNRRLRIEVLGAIRAAQRYVAQRQAAQRQAAGRTAAQGG